jgi:hypothetical protein
MLVELNGVMNAAQALVDARHAGADCRPAWAALEGAIALARKATPPRRERFAVEHGYVVRRVTGGDGRDYWKRCPYREYAAFARALAAHGEPFVRDDVCVRAGIPRNSGLVAMMFLKANGLVASRGRRFHAATPAFSVEAALGAYAALEGRPFPRMAA